MNPPSVDGEKRRNDMTVAILLAAGNSVRMGQDKLSAVLGDRPVLAHTLGVFEACDAIDAIVLVARPQDKERYEALCGQYGIGKLIAVCSGGATRQQSAQNGLAAVPQDCTLLAIHDGARPLLREDVLLRVLRDAEKYGAATAAVPVKDTVKTATADGFVDNTPPRSILQLVQTPQAFRTDLYRKALAAAKEEYTDDCQLLEACGMPVRLTEGSYSNIKITTPEDLRIAGALL